MTRTHREDGQFVPGEATRELGRKAARARWSKPKPGEPYPHDFLSFRDAIGRGGPTRAVWEVLWRGLDGLPLTPEQLVLWQRHTARQAAPTSRAVELWMPAGRRGGKSENIMARMTWRAISRDWTKLLSAGEVGTVPVIASDRDQARNSLRYLKGIAQHELVKPFVTRVLRDSVEFTTGAIVQVHTASWRATRGYTMLDVVLEECAFYQSEDSANPDEEILAAIRPALLTVPDARIYGISSPYAKRGILYAAHRDHWGRDGDDVLVFSADTLALNPTVPTRAIVKAFEDDPARAGSEYGRDGLVAFRADVEAFLSREVIDAVTVRGRYELAVRDGVSYRGFVDVSGGSQDSYTVAIGHNEQGVAVLDAIRETRPPFSPEQVTAEAAKLLRAYHVSTVYGDKYAGEFPRELFRRHGITYTPSERTTSDNYREFLPLVNAGKAALLEHSRLAVQLAQLERRVARSGKDSITHPVGAHDDLAAVCAGVLVLAGGGGRAIDGDPREYAAALAGLRADQLPAKPLVADPVAVGARFQELNPVTGGFDKPTAVVPIPGGNQ